ncbi:hypothetical protein F2Q69_00005080 [Brassica cretica]|uniref:Uncharacterized protein n=1 Tax=Brassica cretica TaxID=69181 RepID=A0A8S9P527_BRACR|nr:hypothetical protein F2Q69_00005080 [Brassica cretica]
MYSSASEEKIHVEASSATCTAHLSGELMTHSKMMKQLKLVTQFLKKSRKLYGTPSLPLWLSPKTMFPQLGA